MCNAICKRLAHQTTSSKHTLTGNLMNCREHQGFTRHLLLYFDCFCNELLWNVGQSAPGTLFLMFTLCIYVCIYFYICIYICIYILIYMHKYICVYVHIYSYIFRRICMCIYIYISHHFRHAVVMHYQYVCIFNRSLNDRK